MFFNKNALLSEEGFSNFKLGRTLILIGAEPNVTVKNFDGGEQLLIHAVCRYTKFMPEKDVEKYIDLLIAKGVEFFLNQGFSIYTNFFDVLHPLIELPVFTS